MKFTLSTIVITTFISGLIAGADPAKAVLNYNIYESSGNVVFETEGSLGALSVPFASDQCEDGAYWADAALICTGPSALLPIYRISGPSSFMPGSGQILPASSVSGITTALSGSFGGFAIAHFYVLGSPIISSAIFNGKTLADFGLTPSSGLLGTWTLNGTTESINVRVVPGPLPLLGAGAAFGFSRRLRRHVNTYRSMAQN